jgi:hypothetical protein
MALIGQVSFVPFLAAAITTCSAADPFRSGGLFTVSNGIDSRLQNSLATNGMRPAELCSDEVFVRRVFLDVIGRIPNASEAADFIRDSHPDKRALLVDNLLGREEFADYLTLKWCDLLRVKAEFPINLWPNAVQAYHRWIYESVKTGMPYDKFVRELVTSSGSNFRRPQVNFYRAVQNQESETIAQAVALTFMGIRLQQLPKDKQDGMAVLFSRLSFKKTAEWKEEIVTLDPEPAHELEAVLPDGSYITIKPNQDPRISFADWLTTPENKWFARNIVNRVWSWLMGYGLIHEPDDIRPDNPPVHPKLLDYLEREFVKSDYDIKNLCRLIMNSSTYQQSSIPAEPEKDSERVFACYPVRRLEAEVLIDALCQITGTSESYSSTIPEPFTYIPEEHRSVELADGSITSQFLEMFGRPARNTGLESERSNEPTRNQRLHLLNSTHIQKKISGSKKLGRAMHRVKGSTRDSVNLLYLTVLSRHATDSEHARVDDYLKEATLEVRNTDLVWALINSKEFLYKH